LLCDSLLIANGFSPPTLKSSGSAFIANYWQHDFLNPFNQAYLKAPIFFHSANESTNPFSLISTSSWLKVSSIVPFLTQVSFVLIRVWILRQLMIAISSLLIALVLW